MNAVLCAFGMPRHERLGMKLALLLAAAFAFTSTPCWAQAEQQEVRHHGMMHAAEMEHPTSKTAKLTVADNPAVHEMVVRVGPVSLSPYADHMTVAQPPTLWLTIPFDGWLTAYHPSLTDTKGHLLPNKLLHHVAFYDSARPDLLCSNKEEHIFGAGAEMNDWPMISGFGYRVRKGDRIRISTTFGNPTAKNYADVFLQVRVEYQLLNESGVELKDIYPAWFNVMECGESGYDLNPGESTKTGQFKLRYSGKLLGVGGRLHDWGQWLVLKNAQTNEAIATLEAVLDSKGRIVSMPVESFADRGGVQLHSGDVIEVTDAYNNPTGKSVVDGAMGIIVGYFLPDQESQLTVLRPAVERPPTR
jgi:hypothetical protein